ncbi:hypothetical protein [Kribbella sp. VKM Ac-2566]|uniref:hypothetical protein n=1 Tax=Kribbella sp. VKM Ac-2566 TaxID=2512218 RepID=UPI001063EBB3|nr:hypothetical protein [Kribbella sp. VKM Ac-2566]TDW91127.1 hypothetical protein EV647_4698 [Kribbella sp. VKM Ac-2566]
MPGEAMHHKGADGARRAKAWLDATTRTRATWTNEDAVAAGRLTFNWPYAGQNEFSYDVGGILFGEPFDNHAFVAEVKNYSGDGLGADFDDFLAKCYLVARDHPKLANQFMFITWHPFRVKTWTQLTDRSSVLDGCTTPKNRMRLLDIDDHAELAATTAQKVAAGATAKAAALAAEEEASAAAQTDLDQDVVDRLCGNLWLFVLSEKQEQLLISHDDRALIVQERVRRGIV